MFHGSAREPWQGAIHLISTRLVWCRSTNAAKAGNSGQFESRTPTPAGEARRFTKEIDP
jgi:hypothetical protein